MYVIVFILAIFVFMFLLAIDLNTIAYHSYLPKVYEWLSVYAFV